MKKKEKFNPCGAREELVFFSILIFLNKQTTNKIKKQKAKYYTQQFLQ